MKINPQGRASSGLIHINKNAFLLFGGASRSESFNDFWICNIFNNQYIWEKIELSSSILNNLTPRYGIAIGKFNNKIYIHGGQDIFQNVFSDLFIVNYEIEENSKLEINSIENITISPINPENTPIERNSHLYCQTEVKLYIIGGGNTEKGLFNDGYYLNFNNFEENKNWNKLNFQLEDSIEMGGVCLYNNKLYVFGGRTLINISNNLYIFNLDEEGNTTSFQIQKIPFKICSFGYTLYRKYFILVGGMNGEAFLNDINIYDIEENRWYLYKKSQETLFTGSICPSVTHNNEYIIIFGGSNIEYDTNQTIILLLEDLLKEQNLIEYK